MYITSMDIRAATWRGRSMLRTFWTTPVVLACEVGSFVFENVDSKFSFTRRLRQGSVEAPTLWLKLAKHIFGMWERSWKKKRMQIHLNASRVTVIKVCSILWADEAAE